VGQTVPAMTDGRTAVEVPPVGSATD
jgi:hypothetical protein